MELFYSSRGRKGRISSVSSRMSWKFNSSCVWQAMPSEAVSKAYVKGVFCIAFPNYMLAVQVEHDFFKAVSGLPDKQEW